jgi:type I restriction enzyme R subunit
MGSNFSFLERSWPLLASIGEQAETYLYSDPSVALVKARQFIEALVQRIYIEERIPEPIRPDLVERLRGIASLDILPASELDALHEIRRYGNRAVHENLSDRAIAQRAVRAMFIVARKVAHIYLKIDPGSVQFTISPKLTPGVETKAAEAAARDAQERIKELESRIADLERKQQQELEAPPRAEISASARAERKQRTLETIHSIPGTEAETRLVIDRQLREAGWEADTEALNYANGTRPEAGRNIAIAEWPFQGKPADYVLFAGKKLVGIIEAKKARKDIPGSIEQAKRYAELIQSADEFEIMVPQARIRKAPFLFATNGRPYLEQLKQKSGIWFLDSREDDNHPHALMAFHSPDGLLHLLKRDIAQANSALQKESIDYLSDPNGLALRPYQINVITAAEEALRSGKGSALIVMATGTGKTRTAIGLVYRLLKSDRFKRVLFLVDRTALGDQASDMFKDARIEDLQTFTQIYDTMELEDRKPDPSTRLQFATVQGLIRRIFFEDPDKRLPVDTYDCIVVDEAHRGYFLEKEMSDAEIPYKNQWDYQSKYRQVLHYFDAVKIALTATPAKHTTDIFGPPIATYSYREAVIDGCLVDHEPPIRIKTALSEEGIKWEKGQQLTLLDPVTGEISKLENVEDELKFDVAQFNSKVVTENFNRVVVDYLAKQLDPDGEEKTLIFAANTMHADMLVALLKAKYQGLDDNAIMKITGAPDTDDPKSKIRRFKNERYPNIVVTVDLLTTGIDVPEICNVVFLRRISSRILYEQMLGRATRLCDRIGKDHFNIYDAVGLYDALKDYTQMQPVVANPQTTISGLVNELERIKDAAQKLRHVEIILSKIQRKKKTISEHNAENFAVKADGKSIAEFVHNVRLMDIDQQVDFIKKNRDLFEYFDRVLRDPDKQFISEHKDKLRSAETGYPLGKKPNDYIQGFKDYILSIRDSNEYVALRTILQKPSELKRKDLRDLLVHLEEKHYDYKTLKRAYEEMTNQEMAASIIGFIRQQALGTPILSHSMRVEEAVRRLKEENDFNKNQLGWLERIGEQLKRELVIDQESFDREPFKQKGGFKQINKIFGEKLPEIMQRLHTEVYSA